MTGRYKAYPDYRKSMIEWMHDVPAHWRNVPLKYMAIEDNSLFLDGDWIESKDISSKGIRYITTGNVGEGVYKEQGAGFISEDTFNKLSCTEVFEGDLLLSRLNAPIGRSCIVPNLSARIVTSVDNVIFRPDSQYLKQFLVYLFSSSSYFKHTSNLARGATMQRISRGLLGNIRVVVPSYKEQQKIANFLDHETAKIDTLIAKQEKLIELLKEKRQAVISHAVTKGLNPDVPMKDSGVEWLGEVPEHWMVGRYKYCTKRIIVGIAEAATHAYADSGVAIVRSTNIKEEQLETHNLLFLKPEFAEKNSSKYLYHNDVVTVRTGYPGISAVVPEVLDKSHCFTNLVATPLKRHQPDFLSEYLNSYVGKAYFDLFSWGSAQQNISVPILQNFPMAFTSTDEELEIVTYIKGQRVKFKKLIKNAEISIDLMKERKTALISAAVTGKIDVRNWIKG